MLELEVPNLHELDLDRVIAFGHTWSPTLELAPDPPLFHGHAINVDMALSTTIAEQRGFISATDRDRVLGLMSSLGLSLDSPHLTPELLRRATDSILQTRDGLLRAAVPRPIGSCHFVNDLDADELERMLEVHREVVRGLPARRGRRGRLHRGRGRPRERPGRRRAGDPPRRSPRSASSPRRSSGSRPPGGRRRSCSRTWRDDGPAGARDLAGGLDPYVGAAPRRRRRRWPRWRGARQREDWAADASGSDGPPWSRRCSRATSRASCWRSWCTPPGPSRVLEIGMFTGYSALAMAEALPDRAAPSSPASSTRTPPTWPGPCFAASPAGDRVAVEVGPALDTLARLAARGARSTWSSSTPTRPATAATSRPCSTVRPARPRRAGLRRQHPDAGRAVARRRVLGQRRAPSPTSTPRSPTTPASSRCCCRCATASPWSGGSEPVPATPRRTPRARRRAHARRAGPAAARGPAQPRLSPGRRCCAAR